MSLYKTLLALPLLAACGFTPVYGPQGAGTALQGRVLVEAPETRDDQLMLQQIERRLGRPGDASFDLGIDLIVTQEGLAIDSGHGHLYPYQHLKRRDCRHGHGHQLYRLLCHWHHRGDAGGRTRRPQAVDDHIG